MVHQITWSKELSLSHLEVRPPERGIEDALTPGDSLNSVQIDGNVARSQRDWVYWRLPTICSSQVFQASEEVEIQVKLERGESRVGMIEQSILLGENWCSSDKAGKTFYLDAYFGVMRSGDQQASDKRVRCVAGDVVTARMKESSLEFSVNNTTVGSVRVTGSLRFAAQMWDRGDCVRLVGGSATQANLDISGISAAPSEAVHIKDDGKAPGTPQQQTHRTVPGEEGPFEGVFTPREKGFVAVEARMTPRVEAGGGDKKGGNEKVWGGEGGKRGGDEAEEDKRGEDEAGEGKAEEKEVEEDKVKEEDEEKDEEDRAAVEDKDEKDKAAVDDKDEEDKAAVEDKDEEDKAAVEDKDEEDKAAVEDKEAEKPASPPPAEDKEGDAAATTPEESGEGGDEPGKEEEGKGADAPSNAGPGGDARGG